MQIYVCTNNERKNEQKLMINTSSIFIRNIKSKKDNSKKGKKIILYIQGERERERENLKPSGGPKEYNVVGIVLSYRRPSNAVFLEMEFSLLATNVEEDRIGNIHS